MKLVLNIFFWAFMAPCAIGLVCLRAEEPKPAPTIVSLTAEIELLNAKVAALQALLRNETLACWSLDLFQSRFDAAMAQKKVADIEAKQKSVAEPKPPASAPPAQPNNQ